METVEEVEYSVDAALRDSFAESIASYFPGIDAAKLTPAYAGIRPRIPATQFDKPDFLIQTPEEHALPGLIQLFGIESPGLTASLALAELAAGHVMRQL